MNPRFTGILLSFWICIIILSGCGGSVGEFPIDRSIDLANMTTPEGEKLKPAEEGPVRSVLGKPKIDLDTFQLSVSGLVDLPFSLTWKEIQALPTVSTGKMVMYCVESWEVWGDWKGVLVADLLRKTAPKEKAEYVMFHCVDGYSSALPISYLEKYKAILAYEVNGKPLPDRDGFPLRLVAFGKYGYKWVKWVNRLEVLDRSREGYWETRGYSDRANVRLGRRRHYEGEDAKRLDY
jgi:DMSO/TMAO reductase YedYZ molybdopterin-dependent catalytic subunit